MSFSNRSAPVIMLTLKHLLPVLLFLFMGSVHAGTGIQYIYLESPTYDYFDYLINANRLHPKFVLRQPYELQRDLSIDSTSRSGRYFHSYWQKYYKKDHAAFHLQARDHLRYDDTIFNRYKVQGGVQYVASHISLANRITVDQDYKNDPLFAGDLSESEHWLYGRVNEAFINLNAGQFDLFLGRIKRNWGLLDEHSLILSSHPYSYDHLLINYTTKHLKFSLIYGHLEDVNGRHFKFPDSLFRNARKHLVGHRLDIRFSDDLQIGLTEMATYGGPGQDFEIAFMNPMNFYYPIQRNDRKEMNGFWAVDWFYRPWDKWTIWGQFLIDDVIVNNDPGVDDRARYDDRLALQVSLRAADMPTRGWNFNLTYNRVWNRTYQSKFTWQNYHYRGYGLGYPCASCEEVKLKMAYWDWFPFVLKNETIYGRYGDVGLTDLFPLTKEDFPIAPVHHNLVNELNLYYLFSPALHFHAGATYREKTSHYSNRYEERSRFVLKIGFSLLMDLKFAVN